MRFPLARAKLNAGARGRPRPGMPTGDGDCRGSFSGLARPDQTVPPPSARRMSPTGMHGQVPCPGPPLAWDASVNAALIAAARPATGIIRQLLIRICILPRSVLCPVPASSGTAQEGSTSHSVSTLKALMPAPVKAEGRALTTHSTATGPHLADPKCIGGRGETFYLRRPLTSVVQALYFGHSIAKNQRQGSVGRTAATMCNEWTPPDQRVRL